MPSVGSSGVPSVVGAVRTNYYPSQSAKNLPENFFEHNLTTSLEAAQQSTSFSRPIDTVHESCRIRGPVKVFWDVGSPSFEISFDR